ncbi:helix-turn-helix transcriptional regulator [Verrucomicrobiota bacterium sgz303538]
MSKNGNGPEVRNRKTYVRIYKIDKLLRAGKCPNTAYLAEKLETSRRTIARDIEFMRESLLMPVEYDQVRGGYYYTDEAPPLPGLQFTEGELFSLCILEEVLTLFQGTELESHLRNTFARLTAGLTEQISVSWEALAKAISVRATSTTVPVDPEILDQARRAVLNHEEIEFLYSGLNASSPEKRRVEPFHLMLRDGTWYVFAFDLEAQDIRTFALQRLTQLRTTGRKFEKGKRHTHPDVRLQHSIGIFSGDKPERIRLRLNSVGARLLSERRYHPTQEITRLPDGQHELTMQVHITPELERWVMGYSQEVEVLEPESLRKRILDNARAMLAWTGVN